MYVGRIVSVAKTTDGRLCAAYRVSSRSFPNRSAVPGDGKVSIVPKPGHESDIFKNPYIAYNCVRIVCEGNVAVVTNGGQTDFIAEKMEGGMSARDALILTSFAMDYEKDDYNTPRVSAVVDRRTDEGWLAVVRHDGLQVERIPLENGRLWHLATYEENSVCLQRSDIFPALTAEEACAHMLGGGVFAGRTNPVTAVAALADEKGFSLAVQDAQS
ncbi:MAG: IMP cyclohydrolase [Candidatus Hydrogenedens sp.]|jgi:IMP cyclohydrolase|nr:IMP cyclohydrolase [Candidatus Hydrogenedens sp.]